MITCSVTHKQAPRPASPHTSYAVHSTAHAGYRVSTERHWQWPVYTVTIRSGGTLELDCGIPEHELINSDFKALSSLLVLQAPGTVSAVASRKVREWLRAAITYASQEQHASRLSLSSSVPLSAIFAARLKRNRVVGACDICDVNRVREDAFDSAKKKNKRKI